MTRASNGSAPTRGRKFQGSRRRDRANRRAAARRPAPAKNRSRGSSAQAVPSSLYNKTKTPHLWRWRRRCPSAAERETARLRLEGGRLAPNSAERQDQCSPQYCPPASRFCPPNRALRRSEPAQDGGCSILLAPFSAQRPKRAARHAARWPL